MSLKPFRQFPQRRNWIRFIGQCSIIAFQSFHKTKEYYNSMRLVSTFYWLVWLLAPIREQQTNGNQSRDTGTNGWFHGRTTGGGASHEHLRGISQDDRGPAGLTGAPKTVTGCLSNTQENHNSLTLLAIVFLAAGRVKWHAAGEEKFCFWKLHFAYNYQ